MLDLRIFFFPIAKLIGFELDFCFLDPCICFVDLAFIGWGGGNFIVIGAYVGLYVFGFWHLFFLEPVYVFFDRKEEGIERNNGIYMNIYRY